MSNHCLVPGCTRSRHARGLCQCCYVAAVRQVKAGRVTWTYLQERGLAAAVQPSVTARSKFLHALIAADELRLRIFEG